MKKEPQRHLKQRKNQRQITSTATKRQQQNVGYKRVNSDPPDSCGASSLVVPVNSAIAAGFQCPIRRSGYAKRWRGIAKTSPSAVIDSDRAGKIRLEREASCMQQAEAKASPSAARIARFGFHPRTSMAKASPSRVIGYHWRQQEAQADRIPRTKLRAASETPCGRGMRRLSPTLGL